MSQTKTEKKVGYIILDISKILNKQTFSSMNDVRKEVFSVVKDYREEFVKMVLKKNGVRFTDKMTARQKRELLDSKFIGIIRDERNNVDRIYREGNVIAYWSRDFQFTFKNGRFLVVIEYKIF